MNLIVDVAKAEKRWSRVLEDLNITDPEKRAWMSEYAEMHQMNENVAYSTLGNLNGMGAIVAPQPSTTPGDVWGGGYTVAGPGGIGSGDVGQNLLPVSMKIAAQTIGLDLVAVKPVASPKVDLLFVDFKYDNDTNDLQKPLVFKLNSVVAGDINGLIVKLKADMVTYGVYERVGGLSDRLFYNFVTNTSTNVEPTTKTNWLEFLGFSRVDGEPMFRTYRQVSTPQLGGVSPIFDATKNTFAWDVTVTAALSANTFLSGGTNLSLVSLMEDHIPGFSAAWNMNTSMNRAQDEQTYPGVIGPDVFTKTVQVGDIEISSALKRTQIEDIKASTGMDIVQKLESVLVNELTQTISKQIVAKVTALAETARSKNTVPTNKFDFNVDNYLATTAPGGETTHSVQRKLVAKINNASNFIATDGRVGPAQYLVTNGNLASVLQDVSTYTLNPPAMSKLNTNGQLYPMGNLGQIAIYVDPYQRWDDNRIFLGRKNSVDQPGLLFLPYLMAQSISLLSESTFAPRMLIRSRFAIADTGFFPEKQFMAIHVTDTKGVLI
jgi:hypothetical protein